jgi:DNA-binding response OmpR family regulator
MAKILLIEDHDTLGFALQAYLEMKGFEVLWSKDGDSGLQAFEKHPVDLCIVDVGLPGRDGFSLAREIRRQSPAQPLVFLTARALKADRLKGFDLGADDYLVKPVDEEELVARIRAILRRAQPESPKAETIPIGQYTFDVQNQELVFPGQPPRRLTEREAHLLLLLCQQKGQLLSRQQVLKEVWSQNDYFTRRSMDVFISRLRKYLSADPAIEIRNVYGSGFVLEVGG